uniref:tribbles homolog 2-like n=1 Tax=Semicossyphus pulcher TaxID=241346 RepID=UPI0037E78740
MDLVLDDLKLRKFVFKNESRSLVKLESLEDTYILDVMMTPCQTNMAAQQTSVLRSSMPATAIQGRQLTSGDWASCFTPSSWGATLSMTLSSLFSKIHRGHFNIPEMLTPKAKCLIHDILRQKPTECLTSAMKNRL